MKKIMILTLLFCSVCFSQESQGPITEIINFRGERVALDSKDLAKALSLDRQSVVEVERVEKSNSDGSVSLINPTAVYRGKRLPIKGTQQSAMAVCQSLGFNKNSNFRALSSLGCRESLELGVTDLFGTVKITRFDNHNCGADLVVVSCYSQKWMSIR